MTTNTTPSRLPFFSGRTECRACGLRFSSVSAFDEHRTGPHGKRGCLSAAELRKRGWAPNAHGYWRLPADPEVFARRATNFAKRIDSENSNHAAV